MRKPIILFTIVCLCLPLTMRAQDLENFVGLTCKGTMPKEFKELFQDKYLQDYSEQLEANKLKKKDAKEFALVTNYYNHNMLLGGSVLYGDEVSTYASKIVDKLLINNTKLREAITLYLIRSNHVNAYSTNSGQIFLTLGLIARLENEAQLAYVLAHEIGHYDKKHVFESFNDHISVSSGQGEYRGMDWERRMLTSLKHNREAEFEADEYGMDLYLKAGYSVEQMSDAFDVLVRGYLPIKEKRYNWDLLQDSNFQISEYFFKESIDPISMLVDMDDQGLTHPNVHKRKAKLRRLLRSTENADSGALFLTHSKEHFEGIRNLARFEMVNTYMRNGDYVAAIYHLHILREEFPTNTFLRNADLFCWTGIQALSNNAQKKIYSSGYTRKEGQSQELFYFFSKMAKKGINPIVVRYIWNQTEPYKDEEIAKRLRSQVLTQLASSGIPESVFKKEYVQVNDSEGSSRNIRKRRYDFIQNAFVELFQNVEFLDGLEKAYEDAVEEEYNEEDDDAEEEYIDNSVYGISTNYRLSGVNKIMYFSPRFYSVNLNRSADERFLLSANEERDLIDRTKTLAQKAGVELVTINDPKWRGFDTESFNDYIRLRDWVIAEATHALDNYETFETRYLEDIRKHYGADYLGINYIWHFQENNEFNFGAFVLAAYLIIPFPYYLYWQIKPVHQMQYTFAVFDLKNGELGQLERKIFSSKYRKGTVNSHLYNSFNQLSR